MMRFSPVWFFSVLSLACVGEPENTPIVLAIDKPPLVMDEG